MPRQLENFDFIYSDPHFGHGNVIKFCNRPFENSYFMNKALIAAYNNRVSPTDHVLWLGDCFFCRKEKALEILSQLNGSKTLIMGNHDKWTVTCYKELGFEEVYKTYQTVVFEGKPTVFSHFPFEGYSEDKRFAERRPPKDQLIIHGHSHDTTRLTEKKTIHVGVDAWDYAPASRSEILELRKQL